MQILLPEESERALSRFLLCNLPPRLFLPGKPVLLFAEKGALPPRPLTGGILIADAEARLSPALKGMLTLTCGPSPKDTFTFSGRGEEEAAVALMRTIPLPGGAAEPMEVPIFFPAGTEDFLLLAATAALVLSDVLEEKNQRKFIRFDAP